MNPRRGMFPFKCHVDIRDTDTNKFDYQDFPDKKYPAKTLAGALLGADVITQLPGRAWSVCTTDLPAPNGCELTAFKLLCRVQDSSYCHYPTEHFLEIVAPSDENKVMHEILVYKNQETDKMQLPETAKAMKLIVLDTSCKTLASKETHLQQLASDANIFFMSVALDTTPADVVKQQLVLKIAEIAEKWAYLGGKFAKVA